MASRPAYPRPPSQSTYTRPQAEPAISHHSHREQPPPPPPPPHAIRRNLFSTSTTSTTSISRAPPHPSAPSRRPPSRPISSASNRPLLNGPSNSSAETLRLYSGHGHAARTQSRTSRPRSRGMAAFGFDGTNDDREMYDDGDLEEAIGIHRPREEREPQRGIEEEEVLIPESDEPEVEGQVKMARGEMEALLENVRQGLKEAEEAEEEEEGEEGGRVKITTEMIETYRAGRGRIMDEPEFLEAAKESLQRKVASIDDDKWMYEEEPDREESPI